MPQQRHRKHIGFWTTNSISDQKFVEWIDRVRTDKPYAQFVRDILTDVMEERLIIPSTEDLKNQKLKVDIKFKKIMIKIKEKELNYWQVFKQRPTPAGQKAIIVSVKDQSESPSCFDEKNKRFQCPICGVKFHFGSDDNDMVKSKEQFIDHYYQLHGELPEKLERELIENI